LGRSAKIKTQGDDISEHEAKKVCLTDKNQIRRIQEFSALYFVLLPVMQTSDQISILICVHLIK